MTISLIISCASKETSTVPTEQNQQPQRESLSTQEVVIQNLSTSSSKEVLPLVEEKKEQDVVLQMVGSSKIDSASSYKRKIYYLYGAEHLNLENYYFDIPVVYNNAVKKWIDYFLNRGRGFFERYSSRGGRYAPLLGKILEDHDLPRDLIFLAMAESGFQNHAKSWARAVGPWQFMPYTGKRYGLRINWYVDERRDPIKSSIAASRYLQKLFNDFGSWELAAAGYNAGEGKVSRAVRRYKTDNFWTIRQGRYLKNETKNYVPKIMALAIIGKNLKSFGFEDIDFHEPLDFDEIDVGPLTDLYQVSEHLDMDFSELQRLNPEILRWFTPPGRDYKLRIPVGMSSTWSECCLNKVLVAKDFQIYKINGRVTRLRSISQKFKLKGDVLENLNNMSSGAVLKKGDEIILPFRLGQDFRDEMYSDLYERPRKSVIRKRRYWAQVKRALEKGRKISTPSEYYTVRKGDTLWTVARKSGVSIDTIIASNYSIIKRRMIRAGDKLAVR